MTHTRLRGVYVLRWVIGQTRVSWEDLAESWEQVKSTARAL